MTSCGRSSLSSMDAARPDVSAVSGSCTASTSADANFARFCRFIDSYLTSVIVAQYQNMAVNALCIRRIACACLHMHSVKSNATRLLQSAAEEAGGHHMLIAYFDQFATVGHPY